MNREITSTVYPLSGDVLSSAGNPKVKVVGFNGIPLETVPLTGGEEYIFDPILSQWTPRILGVLQINGVTVSDDAEISINVTKPALVNGV